MTIRRSYLLAGAAALLFGAVHAIGGFQVFGVELKSAVASSARVFAQEARDGADILNASCTNCHDLTGVNEATYTEEEWQSTIRRMMGYGVTLNEADFDVLVDHLLAQRATTLLEAKCVGCHDLTNVEGGRGVNTEAQWRTIITRMTGYGAVLTEAETEALVAYLLTAPEE